MGELFTLEGGEVISLGQVRSFSMLLAQRDEAFTFSGWAPSAAGFTMGVRLRGLSGNAHQRRLARRALARFLRKS